MNASQPAKFLVVGAAGYVANLTIFSLLHGVGMPYVTASIWSYFISNAGMYLGNRFFTFQLGTDGFWPGYVRYVLVGAAVIGLNALLLAGLVEGAKLPPTPALAIALLLITPVAFVLNKRWTFQLTRA